MANQTQLKEKYSINHMEALHLNRQRLAHKLIFSLLLCFHGLSFGQSVSSDPDIAVIEVVLEKNGKPLLQETCFAKSRLQTHYDYLYNESSEVSKKSRDYPLRMRNEKTAKLLEPFTKDDLVAILNKDMCVDWVTSLKGDQSELFVNAPRDATISRPLYSIDLHHAIVEFIDNRSARWYVLKKDNDKWEIISEMKL